MGRTADDSKVRLEISLRLKAARFLAGGLQKTKKGKVAGAKPVSELAKHSVLRANGIAPNRIRQYEEMKITPRPGELEKIADALSVPRSLLLAPLNSGEYEAELEVSRDQRAADLQQRLEDVERGLQAVSDKVVELGTDLEARLSTVVRTALAQGPSKARGDGRKRGAGGPDG